MPETSKVMITGRRALRCHDRAEGCRTGGGHSTSLDGLSAPGADLVGARTLLTELNGRFSVQRTAPSGNRPDGSPIRDRAKGRRSPFGEGSSPSFATESGGGLSLAKSSTSPSNLAERGLGVGIGLTPDEIAATQAISARSGCRGTRAQAIFPAQASDGLHLSVAGRPDAWLKVRPSGDSASLRAVVDGLLVYPGLMRGVDAIYVASEERIEEFLHLRTAEQAEALSFEVEFGADITSLRPDGSGSGLEALDQDGKAVLRAPAPEGIDATGRHVRGRLVAQQMGRDRWTIRVELTGDAPKFPVLLDPSWAGTGSMAIARKGHTATLLNSGQVLVVGGMGQVGCLASAELYDPTSGTFSATASLSTARNAHTATVLPSGQVLVIGGAGGTEGETPLVIAEIYVPAQNGGWTFSATASLSTARWGHTATLLNSGQVLVVGGVGQTGCLASAELYESSQSGGTFSATGSLSTARDAHTATLLPSGKVLVAGGGGNAGFLTSAELYDPMGGAFSPTGLLSTARNGHTATLLQSGKVVVVGGVGPVGSLASTELYDPAQSGGTFLATGALLTPRDSHTATLLQSGQVLIAGGNGQAGSLASAELYSPTQSGGTFSTIDPLSTERVAHTATRLSSGSVLVVGGSGETAFLASAEQYTPPPSPRPRPHPGGNGGQVE